MEDVQALTDKLKAEIESGKPDEEVFELLKLHLGKDAEADERTAESLAGILHPGAARLLLRMLDVARAKRVRKAIKRSLYRLKGKGVAVEEVPLDRREAIFKLPKAEPAKGFGSGIDSLGERFLLLTIPHSVRGLTVIEAGVSDTRGIVNFNGNEMTRKGFNTFLQGLKQDFPFPLVEIDPSYVAFLITQTYPLTVNKMGTPSQDYLRLKTEIDKIKKDYDKPLIYSYLQADEATEDDRWFRRAGDLLKADVFGDWTIERDRIQPYVDAVGEAEESKLVLNPVQKEARLQEIYQKALSELFSDERRALYGRRLEEMAYILFKMGRQDEARMSLAAAIDLKKPANPFQPNPFLFPLVVKSILELLQDTREKKGKEPSLIVKP